MNTTAICRAGGRALACAAWCGLASVAAAGPELHVLDLFDAFRWGESGGVTGWTFGASVCNVGDAPASWNRNTVAHPVITQNVYKVDGGRIRQIGVSWVKHGFASTNDPSPCGACPTVFDNTKLYPGCQDAYNSTLNGFQNSAGLRSQVNALTGVFTFPVDYTGIPPASGPSDRRVKVTNTEVDPALNPGAQYFAEIQYVAADQSLAGNGSDSVSFRPFTVNSNGGSLTPAMGPSATRHGVPGVLAWKEVDPQVELARVDIPGEGTLWLAWRVTDLGDGRWRYDYALQNINSDRAAGSISLPVGCAAADDPDQRLPMYHSGEIWSNAAWAFTRNSGRSGWETAPFATNPTASALRWSSLASFRFTSDRPPVPAAISVGLFKPGGPAAVTVAGVGPQTGADFNADGFVDFFDYDAFAEAFENGDGRADFNGDAFLDFFDFDGFVGAFDAGC